MADFNRMLCNHSREAALTVNFVVFRTTIYLQIHLVEPAVIAPVAQLDRAADF